ncbi:hypothetical protein AAEX28_03920 [Lentisphaerota bacterium WC36G]|nr:hypothetical protein LJT99_06795 [Lentisphaerae bacterium WC36]
MKKFNLLIMIGAVGVLISGCCALTGGHRFEEKTFIEPPQMEDAKNAPKVENAIEFEKNNIDAKSK